jgi:hypothetical protein
MVLFFVIFVSIVMIGYRLTLYQLGILSPGTLASFVRKMVLMSPMECRVESRYGRHHREASVHIIRLGHNKNSRFQIVHQEYL